MRVDPEDLYERLHSLSKVLESSGVIDESEHRDAYPTILDAMNFVRSVNGRRVATMTIEQNMGATLRAETGFTVKPGDKFVCYRDGETP